MRADEYFNSLDDALQKINQTIIDVELKKTDEFDKTNYAEILFRLNTAKKSIERMIVAYRYFKLSKEAFVKLSEEKGSRRLEVLHTVKEYETPHSIASKYGITVSDLLRKNNIISSEITAGKQIKVEVRESRALNKVFEEIPTFGSQEGLLVLGKDVTNTLRESNTGDLFVLEPEKNMEQGVKNRIITKAGDYPLELDFGVADIVGGELPQDLNESYYKLRIINQLSQDRRIVSVNALDVTRQGNSVIIEGNVTAVNNKDLVIL